jgi:hypothetical protein
MGAFTCAALTGRVHDAKLNDSRPTTAKRAMDGRLTGTPAPRRQGADRALPPPLALAGAAR